MNNAQTFSNQSDQYAKNRPQYPAELFQFLSEICKHHDLAWDCATGNGQAAVSCAEFFSQVEATDLSPEQIQHHISHPRVRYSVSPAEQTSFENQSFDLITVAQAVHWFDLETFYQEVDRVLKPNGILAIWGYGFLEIEPQIDGLIAEYLLKPIDPFWASGNRLVMNSYRDLALPFEQINIPKTFNMNIPWNLAQLSAYFRTWSAVKRYRSELNSDPVSHLETALMPIWDDPEKTKLIHMPLFLKARKKPA